MCTTYYLENLLHQVNRVSIDTSSLMETEKLEKFIVMAEPVFAEFEKQIIVPGSVQNELIGFLDCGGCEKSELAEQVFRLLDEHHEMFRLEERVDGEDFADREILSELMRNKGDCGQLLITNDKKLAKDAFQLNQQESNRGRKIMVCHLNHYGDLSRCDCTKPQEQVDCLHMEESVQAKIAETLEDEVPQCPVTPVRRTVDKPAAKKHRWKLPAAIAGGFAGGFIGGIAFDRYAIPMIRKAAAAI